MRILLIFLLGLITLQVNAQTKIIGSTTTAGGDLQGQYPSPTIKNNIINRANLTASLRDSLTRFRKDTTISTGGVTLNLNASINALGKYNRVYINIDQDSAVGSLVILPFAADTLANTEFYFRTDSESDDSTAAIIRSFDGFIIGYDGVGYVTTTDVPLRTREWMRSHPFEQGGNWYWEYTRLPASRLDGLTPGTSGITALTGDVTASGTGSVAATIANNAITSAKILDATIVSADIASQTVDSLDLKNRSITTVKLDNDAVTSLKVLDNSLTGSDLTYLTLRAGTTSNASLQLTSGSDKTTLTGGEILYNGRFAVGIGSSKRRIVTTSDAAATAGQIPIGNGSDFTNATLTAGYAQTVTNGTGSIEILPDTTKVIPFIPTAEISNGTRNGYFWNKTSGIFGHQFYKFGFRIFNNSIASSTSAASGISVGDLTSTSFAQIQASMTSAGVPTIALSITGTERGNKNYSFTEQGASLPVIYSTIGSNSQAVATYQIDGESSIEYITNSTPTDVTLPEIVGTSLTANKVGVGFTMYLVVNAATGKNINAAGSDVIIRHGSSSTVTTFTTTGGTYYIKKFVALELNTWGEL